MTKRAKPFVKMCGIRSLEDAQAALSCGADALGFNFYPNSARYVAEDLAADIISKLPKGPWYVGVFVNEDRAIVEQIAKRSGLTALQFHGDEDEQYLSGWELPSIRALRLGDDRFSANDIVAALNTADYLLFDRYEAKEFGGSGREISSVELLSSLEPKVWERSFLAGGLNAENVSARIERYRPFGVDVASGIEDAKPGYKSKSKMQEFIAAIQ
jgi:phosphoribosylanthranilate isomerase